MDKVIGEHICINEDRIVAIETRLSHKKEDIHEMHSDYYHLRNKLEQISINVAELTTIMKEQRDKENVNDEKIEDLKVEITKLQSSLDTFKWLVPVACAILTFIVNYLI